MNVNLLTLTDGRTLEWADNGITSTSALILHHGTTIAMDVWGSWCDEAAMANVRAITINRAGIGRSTSHHGRRIADDVSDLRELIEHLQLNKFVSVGWSGGGARALGTGLIEGALAVHTIAGISPINLNDEETISWMPAQRRAQIAQFHTDFDAIVEDRREMYEEDLKLTHEALLQITKSLSNFSKYEDDYLQFSQDLFNSVPPVLVNGPKTDAEDYCANISPWGFNLDDVNVPVTIWHGIADEDVVIDRGRYLHAHLPQSELITFDDQGHVTIMVEKRSEILAAAIQSLRSE